MPLKIITIKLNNAVQMMLHLQIHHYRSERRFFAKHRQISTLEVLLDVLRLTMSSDNASNGLSVLQTSENGTYKTGFCKVGVTDHRQC